MTSQTGNARVDWRRTIAGGVLAVGLMSGFGVSTAFAQPAEPTDTSPPRACTGEDCTRDAERPLPQRRAASPTTRSVPTRRTQPKKLNGDQILMQIYEQYRQGDGGGQISILIDDAVKLRKQGFPVSNANAEALQEGLDARPNQTELVEALKSTIQYQRKLQAQQQMAAQAAATVRRQRAGHPGQLTRGRARRKAARHPRLPGGPRLAASGGRRVSVQPTVAARLSHRRRCAGPADR